MESIEYIKFIPKIIENVVESETSIGIHNCFYDSDMCINHNGRYWHIELKPFGINGDALEFENNYGCLNDGLEYTCLDEIKSFLNDDESSFILAFKVTGDGDFDNPTIVDSFDYDLLGVVEQDGYNLIVKPWSANNAADCTSSADGLC